MSKAKLFHKDFTLMVIGQIISIFGNTILRFALPLYLLNETGSATLLGLVSAISFIPMIILSPVGGIIADRVNKRNVMVVLDFFTAALILVFTLLLGKLSLVPLMIITMMFLYGIQGSYQPAVQASLPALLNESELVSGNAVINIVNSLAGLIGPVFGGMLYGFYGLTPILIVSIFCFTCSAIMEIFIHIPFTAPAKSQGVMGIVKSDLKESVRFIRNEQPIIAKCILIVAAFNLFLSSMLMVGAPVIITELLGFEDALGNQLYGYSEGALAAGGLIGGILAGVLGNKLNIRKGHWLLMGAAAGILPMGLALWLDISPMFSYLVITISGCVIMILSTIFSIVALAFIQKTTPEALIGKVVSVVMAVCMCAQPLGQALYGVLFDKLAAAPYLIIFFAAGISIVITLFSKTTFSSISSDPAPPVIISQGEVNELPAQ